ncbi:hypothetical protein Taro_039396 [Colocasia esculenta]|uniref:Endonuclease/exonuclease/phosphatase domain-containing protein n=1 Tax=Colocasia esculenta TaxID=4460 RepID=A0A843WAK5_COLES|nr:hypothetical protein [Colocasia esculenta]
MRGSCSGSAGCVRGRVAPGEDAACEECRIGLYWAMMGPTGLVVISDRHIQSLIWSLRPPSKSVNVPIPVSNVFERLSSDVRVIDTTEASDAHIPSSGEVVAPQQSVQELEKAPTPVVVNGAPVVSQGDGLVLGHEEHSVLVHGASFIVVHGDQRLAHPGKQLPACTGTSLPQAASPASNPPAQLKPVCVIHGSESSSLENNIPQVVRGKSLDIECNVDLKLDRIPDIPQISATALASSENILLPSTIISKDGNIGPIKGACTRGLSNLASKRSLKHLIRKYNLHIVAIFEPKIKLSRAASVCRYLNLHDYAGNAGEDSKIWLLWSKDVSLQVSSRFDQFISANILKDDALLCMITAVYTACDMSSRRLLYDDLLTSNINQLPWMVGGDFNCVSSPSEKEGGSTPNHSSMIDFNSFISAAGLLDAGFSGQRFTWSNNRVGHAAIKARLDRVLITPSWTLSFPGYCVKHLPRLPSDHAPLLMKVVHQSTIPARFIFQKMWVSHENFIQQVTDSWRSVNATSPNPFVTLQAKLKAVKAMLKDWNKNIFGNVEVSVRQAEDRCFLIARAANDLSRAE